MLNSNRGPLCGDRIIMNDDTISLEIDEDSTIGTRPHPGGGFILVVFTKDQKEVNLHFQPQFWEVIGEMFGGAGNWPK